MGKKRLIDIGLVIIIIAMAVLVYFQISRLVEDVRGQFQKATPPEEAAVQVTSIPTPESKNVPSATLAPDFELSSLGGEVIALSDYRGQAVMINFWAIWCPPCRAELPLIESFAERHADDLVVMAINMGEDQTNVYHFVNEFGYDLLFLLDPSTSVGSKFMVRGLPTSIFIDADGLIQARHIGILDETLLRDYLSQAGVVE